MNFYGEHIFNILESKPPTYLIKEDLQEAYDTALRASRKEYGTSSATKALCLSLGFYLDKNDLQKVRLFLFNAGVTLKVGDRQCVDHATKQKKSDQQKKIRSLDTDTKRVAKIKQTISNKPKEELDRSREKQKSTLTKTLAIKMADRVGWEQLQNSCQEKAKAARSRLPKEYFDRGILKWKETHWAKSDEERYEIKTKKEKANKLGFWLDDIWFGSSFELNMYQFLNRQSIDFVFQGLACDLGGYTWHPDFYLPDHNLILEVKGAYPKSKNYWLTKTLPKILDSNLFNLFDIRVYWGRKIKASTLQELLDGCEVIKG